MAKRRYDRSSTVRWIDDEGFYHREDGPAVVWDDGEQYWARRGRSHFAYGPSILYADGTLAWCEDGRERYPYG